MKRWISGWVGLWLVTMVSVRAQEPAVEEPAVLPAVEEPASESSYETLAVVEIRGVDGLMGSLERLGSVLMVPVQKDNLRAQLSFFLMTTNLTGLDADGLIRFYILGDAASPTSTPGVVLSLRVRGEGEEYLDAISERMEQTDSIRGVDYYKSAASPTAPSPWPSLCLRVTGGYALLGQAPAPIEALSQEIDGGIVRQDERLPVEGDLVLALQIKKATEFYGPLIEQQMEAVRKKADEKTRGQPQDVGEMLSIEQRLFTTLLQQVDRYMIGVKTSSDWMEFTFRTEASSGSTFGKLVGSLQAPSPAFQQFLPADALYAQAGHWGNMDLWIEPYMEYLNELYAAMGPGMSGMSSVLMESVKAMKGQYSGDVAMAVLPPTTNYPIQFVELIGVRDPQALKASMEQMILSLNQLNTSTLPAEVSFEMASGPSREYAGVAIDTYEYRTRVTDEMMQKLPFLAQRLIDNMRFEVAYFENAVIYAIGPSELMNASIDRFNAGSGQNPREAAPFKAVFAEEVSEQAVDAYYANLLDTLRTVLALSPSMDAFREMLPPSRGTIAGYEEREGLALNGYMRISLTDLGDILKYVMALQAKIKPKMAPTVLSTNPEAAE